MEKNPGMFSPKTLISFRLKKEWHGHLGWHGGELSAKVFLKWTTPLSYIYCIVSTYYSTVLLVGMHRNVSRYDNR